ncbi:MAG: CDC48 family AAA ATPase [Nanoarchaeota archaeon]|nr:CDC48 family AAA ATPase [Nanoarchaeota archaeon]
MERKKSGQDIRLKVAEAIQDDVNKGIVRIDNGFMQQIGVRVGDIVEIEGERQTVAITDRAYPGDLGLNIIRMDGIVRRNAKTGIGELVSVRKADVKEAKKVTIAPSKKGIMIRASPEIFKQGLLGRSVVKGDIVSLGGTRRRRTAMMDNPFFEDVFSLLDESVSGGFGFGDIKFVVADTNPKQPVIISEQTEIVFNPEAVEITEEKILEVTYEDIGGLQEEITKIREMVELPLKHPELFERLGIEPPKGVLLHGPPGTGKTLLAKAVANETNSHFILINGPEIMSKYYGQSEENIRKKFEEAQKHAPSIIFIDEIDAIAAKREETKGEVERRVVAQLLANMDGLQSRGKIVVIAATNVPNLLDPALRRPGRFDREIEIGVPSKQGRLDVLKIHTRNMPLYTKEKAVHDLKDVDDNYKEALFSLLSALNSNRVTKKLLETKIQKYLKENPDKNDLFQGIDSDKLYKHIQKVLDNPSLVSLNEISNTTYGFVGADLSALAKEAAMVVLRRVLPDLKLDEEESIPKELLDSLLITQKDFKESLRVVRPSALREVFIEKPTTRWTDIGGLEGVKQELIEAVEWPLKTPESFTRLGVKPPKGILMYGAPGTGKTLLARAVARESNANFISIKGPELLSKWVGESEKAVREIFKKARQTAPTIIFFDEIDSLAPKRGSHSGGSHVTETVVNQMLTEMDGLEEMQDVVIIAASNRPDIIDTSLLRPGRFDRIILVPAPDEETRFEIFNVHTKGIPLGPTKEEIAKLDRKEKEKNDIIKIASKLLAKKDKKEDITKDYKKMTDNQKMLYFLTSKTEGYAGADIEAVCREAAILALRNDMKAKVVTMEFFEAALDKIRPSVTADVEKAYEELGKQFTSAKGKQMKEEMPSYFG